MESPGPGEPHVITQGKRLERQNPQKPILSHKDATSRHIHTSLPVELSTLIILLFDSILTDFHDTVLNFRLSILTARGDLISVPDSHPRLTRCPVTAYVQACGLFSTSLRKPSSAW